MEALKATTAIVMATHMVLLKTTTAMDIHMEILPQIIMATVMHTHMALLKTTIVIFMVIPVEIPHKTIMAIVMHTRMAISISKYINTVTSIYIHMDTRIAPRVMLMNRLIMTSLNKR